MIEKMDVKINGVDVVISDEYIRGILIYGLTYLKRYWKRGLIVYLFYVGTLILGSVFWHYSTFSEIDNSGNLFKIFVLTPPFLWVAYILRVAITQNLKNDAIDLGYHYASTASIETVDGAFFSIGRSQRITDVLTGAHEGNPVRIYTYSTLVPMRKDSNALTYEVFELTYSFHVPHVLFESSRLPFFGNDVGGKYQLEQVSVWGDTPNTPVLFVERNFEIEALQLFSPAVLKQFSTTYPKMCIEIFQNRLYICLPEMILGKNELVNFLKRAGEIEKIITPILVRMESDVLAMEEAKSS